MKRSVLVLALLLIAFSGITSVLAGMSGPSATGIQIQNLSQSSSADISLSMYNQTGGAAVSVPVSPNPIPSSGFANIYMPATSLGAGVYSGVISSSAPLGAIIRTDWSSTGGAAIYQTVDPAQSVTVPLVTYQYANQTSQFTVQNADAVDATDVAITLYKDGQSAPFASLTGQSIALGASKTYSLTDIQPGLAAGFVGSVVVSSATRALVVQSFIDIAGSRGVSGFSGVPTSSASTSLFCPLIRANYYGDTGINVVNPSGSQVTVTITFRNVSGTSFVQSLPVPANSSATAFQGVGGNSRTGTTPALPWGSGQSASNPTPTNNGFFGSAEITSTSTAVLAVVNDTKFGAGWSVQSQSTYNCLTASDAGTVLALPLVRSMHLTGPKLTTGIQVQNTSGGQITVAMELYNSDGTRRTTSEPAPVVIPANGSGNFWAGAFANANNWVGAGVLKVTVGSGNIVAIVSDEGYGSVAVDSANYAGMKMTP